MSCHRLVYCVSHTDETDEINYQRLREWAQKLNEAGKAQFSVPSLSCSDCWLDTISAPNDNDDDDDDSDDYFLLCNEPSKCKRHFRLDRLLISLGQFVSFPLERTVKLKSLGQRCGQIEIIKVSS